MAAGTARARAQAPTTPTSDDDARPSFAEWLASVRAKRSRAASGRRSSTRRWPVIHEPLPIVLERDRAQAETVLSLERYITRRLTPTLVQDRRARRSRRSGRCSTTVGARYGVPPAIIVAIWGVESNFGRLQRRPADRRGARDAGVGSAAVDVLPRRAVRRARDPQSRRHRVVAACKGSWAGAMGQAQFMPSSYLQVRRGLRRRRPARHLGVARRTCSRRSPTT